MIKLKQGDIEMGGYTVDPGREVRYYKGEKIPWYVHDCTGYNSCSFCRSLKRRHIRELREQDNGDEDGLNRRVAGPAILHVGHDEDGRRYITGLIKEDSTVKKTSKAYTRRKIKTMMSRLPEHIIKEREVWALAGAEGTVPEGYELCSDYSDAHSALCKCGKLFLEHWDSEKCKCRSFVLAGYVRKKATKEEHAGEYICPKVEECEKRFGPIRSCPHRHRHGYFSKGHTSPCDRRATRASNFCPDECVPVPAAADKPAALAGKPKLRIRLEKWEKHLVFQVLEMDERFRAAGRGSKGAVDRLFTSRSISISNIDVISRGMPHIDVDIKGSVYAIYLRGDHLNEDFKVCIPCFDSNKHRDDAYAAIRTALEDWARNWTGFKEIRSPDAVSRESGVLEFG